MDECPFPAEADAANVDPGLATVMVTVGGDGAVLSASVVKDSGHGFGRAAQRYLIKRRSTDPARRSCRRRR
jgi:outer membrane biosynthesis protein TonB